MPPPAPLLQLSAFFASGSAPTLQASASATSASVSGSGSPLRASSGSGSASGFFRLRLSASASALGFCFGLRGLRAAGALAAGAALFVGDWSRRLQSFVNKKQPEKGCFFVIPERFERSTHSLEGCCSIQLSYGTIILQCKISKISDYDKIYSSLPPERPD